MRLRPKHLEKRKRIFDSIRTELKHLTADCELNEICQQTHQTFLDDIANNGYVKDHKNHRTIMDCLLGAGILEGEKHETIKHQVRAMLTTHLRLLLSMDTMIDDRNTEWTPVQVGKGLREKLPASKQHDNISISTQDLQAGKIICRIKISNKHQNTGEASMILLNIRSWMIETAPMHLSNYNIGLGAAGTRTQYQKMRAQEYTQKVISDCKKDGDIIYVDGSIHSRATQAHQFGGAGIIRLDNRNKSQSAFMGQVETKDAQQAELSAIEHALRLLRDGEIKTRGTEHILCDCKNAVNYVQESFHAPWKYIKTLQRIKELMLELESAKIKVSIHWIPGHVDTIGNELADAAAKSAAALWLSNNAQDNTETTLKVLRTIYRYRLL